MDPDGEWFGIDDLIVSIVGGVINLGSNLIQGNVHNVWQGLSLFAIGAAAGEASLYTGGNPYVAAAITSVGNDLVNQGFNNGKINWDQVGMNLVMSEITAGVGSLLNYSWGSQINSFVSDMGIESPALSSMLSQSLMMSASGATIDGGLVAINGGSLRETGLAVLRGAGTGLVVGAVSGLGDGIIYARQERIGPWSGRCLEPGIIESEGNYQDIIRSLNPYC